MCSSTATVMAGFVFSQLTNPVPPECPIELETAYLIFTALCLALNLCIITWTVLCCMWAPGMALRGPEGIKSFHQVIDFLKGEQTQIYNTFMVSVFCYFGSTCSMVWVYPSDTFVNTACMWCLGFFLVVITVLMCRLECQIGGSFFSHEGADGRIRGFRNFERVSDIDQHITKMVPAAHNYASYQPGMYEGSPLLYEETR